MKKFVINGAMVFKSPNIIKPTAMIKVKQYARIGSLFAPTPCANGFNGGNNGSSHTA